MVTITLKPKLYKYTSQTQLDLTYNKMLLYLYTVNYYLMIAELTETGNIHYHVIVFYKQGEVLINFINKCKKDTNLGFIHVKNKIESTEALNNTYNYLIKDIKKTKRVIKNIKVIYGNIPNTKDITICLDAPKSQPLLHQLLLDPLSGDLSEAQVVPLYQELQQDTTDQGKQSSYLIMPISPPSPLRNDIT